jgi:hypothetical protein
MAAAPPRRSAVNIKAIEIRDRGTLIPAIALEVSNDCSPHMRGTLRKAGFALEDGFILLVRFHQEEMRYDPFGWKCNTMRAAHQIIKQKWAELKDGDVVDVEFERGETEHKKLPEINPIF